MTDEHGLRLPARVLLPPGSISDAARSRLAAYSQAAPEPEWPDPADSDAWKAMARHIDAQMIDQLGQHILNCEAKVEVFFVDGVPVQLATSQIEHHPGAIYLDIHGGGFTCFGGKVCHAFGRLLSARLGVTVCSPDYRLPPDGPFPAGLDDTLKVYSYLLQRFPSNKIIVGGQSTGGNIALALVLLAKSQGLAPPAGLVLLTPHIDLSESGDSFQVLKGIDPGLAHGLAGPNRLYAGDLPLTDPAVSPLFAEIEPPFPSTFLQAGTRDLLLSNAVRLYRSMRASRLDVELQIYEAMPHGGFGGAPEDAEADDDLRAFLARALKP